MSTSYPRQAPAARVWKCSMQVQCFGYLVYLPNQSSIRLPSPSAAAIASYKIVAVPVEGSASINVTGMGSSVTGGLRQFVFTAGNALSPGQQYNFWAYAINAAGQSSASAPVAYTAPEM